VSGALTVGAALHGGGCQATPITVPVRSLERSGKVAFVCLDPPGPAGTVEEPLSKCSAQQFTAVNEYLSEDDAGDIDAGSGAQPHLYALVTQTTRGEVAVIDTSSTANSVLDENPLEPGANFLPVGALPTGIVATPGSVATFVGVAEKGRAGIFAIASSRIRPTSADPVTGSLGGGIPFAAPEAGPVPQLSSWPACALPSAPGDMIVVADPAIGVQERRTCDAPYTMPGDGDLISTREKGGRQKLVVAMPEAGGIIVLDAQTILDLPPGSFDACPVERWVPLQVDLTGLGTLQPPPTGPACVNPPIVTPQLQSPCITDADCGSGKSCDPVKHVCPAATYTAHPGGISYADGVLYVADISAPVVHVVDLPTPCSPVERAPLLPTSAETPARVVLTSRVAAAPFPTPDLKRFVYATDIEDQSIMVFDVGPSAASRRPLVRPGAERNPFQPRDRVKFSAPAADLIIVQRDVPETNPITQMAAAGVRCDPNPFLLACTATSTSCDIASAYQTHTGAGDTTDYTVGAGPLKLRGEFAYAALTSGKLAVIDVDDFDARCRGPAQPDPLFGFPDVGAACLADVDCGTSLCVQGACKACMKDTDCAPAPDPALPLAKPVPKCDASTGICAADNKTSLELSHLVVEPNTPRSANYIVQFDTIGDHVPGLLSFPLLYNAEGSLIPLTDATGAITSAQMIPLPTTIALPLFVGGALATTDDIAGNHALNINYEDPRAHVADQNWTATFEGGLPGFDQRLATLDLTGSSLKDPNSRFCDLGVLSQGAITEILAADNADVSRAPALADYVQILSDLPGDQDAYWESGAKDGKLCNGATCSYTACLEEFGAIDQPLPSRDLRILEAFQDHVDVEMRAPAAGTSGKPLTLDDLCCCLPNATAFTVRGGDQWIMIGDSSGFLHHVVADAATGRCRNNCDPFAARKNGRVIEAAAASVTGSFPRESDFQNPMFHFGITAPPPSACQTGADCSTGVCDSTAHTCGGSVRDSNFRFTTNGSFQPLLVSLTADATALILPQAITYVSSTGELAITDGSLNGLIFVSLSSATLTRSFF
jgi:hypothetical protein